MKIFNYEIKKAEPKAVEPIKRVNFGMKSAKSYTRDYSQRNHPIATDDATIILKEYIESDPDLAANLRRFVDNVLMESPKIIPKKGEKIAESTIKNYNEQLAEVRFYKLMRAAIYSLLWNGNAFFEIKFRGKKLTEMYVIDPDTIDIVKDKTGTEVTGYEQQVSESRVIKFLPEEIIHISIDHLDSGVWGKSFIKSLTQTLKRKEIAEYYLQWLLQNNKIAPLVNIKASNLSDEQWDHILQEFKIKETDPNYTQVINSNPDDKVEIMRIFTLEDMSDVMKYIDEQKTQIMTLLQVPPIIAGTVDNSNRSNSEIQARLVFYNTIKAFQNIVAEELDYEMLKKLQWNKVRFKFPAVDQRNDVETIKLAKSLKQDLHFTDEALLEFLKESGFKVPQVETLFEEVVEEPTKTNSDDFPSREPRDKAGIPENEAQRLEDKAMGVSSNEN